jgi:Zn-dependent protease with chaperone function
MITTIRAAISVVLLLGFYVLALALVGGLAYGSYYAWTQDVAGGATKLGYLAVVVAIGVLLAFWRVVRARPELPPGLPLAPDQAPQLWGVVRDLAAQAKTRAPEQIMLVPEVNAAVVENARVLGLVGGERRLYLGVPLLQGLTVGQLRAIVAHELGHYSGQHTRLSAISYRGRLAVFGTAEQLAGKFGGWIFKLYARFYVLVESAVSRRQELEADRSSVRVAGRATAQSALQETEIVAAAWNFYQTTYVDPAWDSGFAPQDMFAGFGAMLKARSDELAELRTETRDEKQSWWDSHPPTAARIRAMDAMPDSGAAPDTRAAVDLIPLFDGQCVDLSQKALRVEGRTVLPWQDFSARAVAIQEQRLADTVLRMAARLAGTPTADVGTVLDLLAAGRLRELADPLVDTSAPEVTVREFVEPLTLVLRVAAIRCGAAYLTLDWAGAPVLTSRTGALIDLREVARLALDPATVALARARLTELGIDTRAAIQVDTVATASGGEIVDGYANVKIDGEPHDLLILDNGLILVPCPKKTDGGKSRMIALIQSGPVAELARHNRFLSYEEIARADLTRRVPMRYRITLHNGQQVNLHTQLTADTLTKNTQMALATAMVQFAATDEAATA